tara:strand:- start:1330 stop:2115 length:786 start_codon:yes stop_codon:yes gene_type:complete
MTLTLVTAWYTIKSKFDKRHYQIWMKNFLTNIENFNLVIYTNKESYPIVAPYHNKNIKIIFKEFEEFKCFKYNWKKNHERNNLLNHNSHLNTDCRLNMLWNEKISFVNETINNKIFESEWYGWCDIGYFRSANFNISQWPNLNKINSLNKNLVYYAKVNSQINYLIKLILNKNEYGLPSREIPPNQLSFAGGFFLINKDNITWWFNAFYSMLELYFKHNYLVKDDQMIVLTCIANNLNKFGIIEEKDKRLDPWFVFQRFLL